MTDNRTSETPTPNAAAPHSTTTVIERRGGGGTMLIGLALLIAVIVGAYFLWNQSQSDSVKTEAITGAADAVKDGATAVGDAAKKTVE